LTWRPSYEGFAAEETRAAFARAEELAGTTDDFSERFAVLLGRLGAASTAGELRSARELVLTLSREADEAGRVTEARGMNWWLGLIAYWHGDFLEARTHCERAIGGAEDPNADPKVRERFGDLSAHGLPVLAATMWQLGEVERARELIDLATHRASQGDAREAAHALFWKSYLEIWRGDPVAALTAAEALDPVAREHGMMQYVNEAELHEGWARGRMNDPMAGAAEMRRVLTAFVAQRVRVNLGFYTGLLAQLETETLGADHALARIDEAFRLSEQVEHGCSLPFLHRLRGEILLTRNPADPAPAEEAFRTSIAVANEQGARSPVLLASLALARLLQSTGRLAEAHAVLTPALESFSPTPEMPEIAEAQALLAALAETEEVKAAEAQRQRRLHLQTAYGQAMMWAKGFSAEETRDAFSRATELAAKTDNFADRFAAGHFQWTFAFVRGELRSARELELSFLKEAEDTSRVVEAGVARRGLALACYQAADFLEARTHCERALEICDPECERETQDRFHDATGPVVMSVLAMTMWQLGEVERARELIEQANRCGSELGHGPSMAHPLFWKSRLEILRGDAAAALSAAKALEDLSREHEMPFWRTDAQLLAGWPRGRLHDAATGAADLRRALAERVDQVAWGQGAWFDAPFFKGLLAELEAETLDTEKALARIDEAIALARQVETRCNLPFLHLLRGKLLMERDPSNSALAEEAFRTALAIAQEQGARSWGLRAAMSLAKLYQSTARPVDAHAVLAPALEGFSPTPEMPEITEAQALLVALTETEEVKNAAASRQRRLQLQTSFSRALMYSRGMSSEEAKAAFTHAQELARAVDNASERFDAYFGLFVGSLTRAELRSARETAEKFLCDAEKEERTTEAAAARRCLGLACLFQGDLAVARAHFEQALRIFDPERDLEARFRFGHDAGVAATLCLAHTNWLLGEVGLVPNLAEEAIARAVESGHVPTQAQAHWLKALFDAFRDDAEAGRRAAESLLEVSRGHGLGLHLVWGELTSAWARARLGDRVTGMTELRQALAAYADQGNKVHVPFFQGRLAELEAAGQEAEGALTRIDEALALAEQTEQRWTDAFLHRIRGDILLKANPENPDRAEEAYRAAIAVARDQSSRSFGLQAALKLAKLYQSTGRPVEAHDVLAPALKGFSTEMSEFAEAQALLERLAAGGEGAIASKDQAT
jgi:tetratricopeptide (TPR) repeat protein